MTSPTEFIQHREPKQELIEIRLSDISRFFKRSLTIILLCAFIGAVIGAFYGFSKADEYDSQLSVMPEMQSGGGSFGGLSSLAGLAGINIDNATSSASVIRPELYPTVLQSVPFAMHMLKQPVFSRNFNEEMTLQRFLERQQQNTPLRNMLGLETEPTEEAEKPVLLDPKNHSKALQLSDRQEGFINNVRGRVSVSGDKRSGVITISARFPDPVVAATVARLALEYLTNYVVSYRTEKVRQQARFLGQRVEEARNRYRATEYSLESFRDRNRNLFGNVAKLEEQRLQADYLLAQTVYNDLSKQLEQAKIRVQEETPVFKMLEPPRVPQRKSEPKRSVTMLLFAIAGAFVGIGFSLIRLLRQPKTI